MRKFRKSRSSKPSNAKNGWYITTLFDSSTQTHRNYNCLYKNGTIIKKRLIKEKSSDRYQVQENNKNSSYEVYDTRDKKVISESFDRTRAIHDSAYRNHGINPDTKGYA